MKRVPQLRSLFDKQEPADQTKDCSAWKRLDWFFEAVIEYISIYKENKEAIVTMEAPLFCPREQLAPAEVSFSRKVKVGFLFSNFFYLFGTKTNGK